MSFLVNFLKTKELFINLHVEILLINKMDLLKEKLDVYLEVVVLLCFLT